MTLSFKTQINGQPTYFADKIIKGLTDKKIISRSDVYPLCIEYWGTKYASKYPLVYPKLHTIRKDDSDRWKAGNKIHFVINNRTKNRLQFAPVVNVVSIQKVLIDPIRESIVIVNSATTDACMKKLNDDNTFQFALNDGFNSLREFFSYFRNQNPNPKIYKIIHWTSLTY